MQSLLPNLIQTLEYVFDINMTTSLKENISIKLHNNDIEAERSVLTIKKIDDNKFYLITMLHNALYEVFYIDTINQNNIKVIGESHNNFVFKNEDAAVEYMDMQLIFVC